MVHNLEKTLDNIEKKGIEKGIERGIEKNAKETAIRAIEMGMDDEIIIKLTGLTNEEINLIRREKSYH